MKIILTCLVCALCLGVLVRLDVTMLSGQAQAFFQETVAPVLHVDTTGSKLRNLFVPVLADSEVDTTGNRWDKVAVSAWIPRRLFRVRPEAKKRKRRPKR